MFISVAILLKFLRHSQRDLVVSKKGPRVHVAVVPIFNLIQIRMNVNLIFMAYAGAKNRRI